MAVELETAVVVITAAGSGIGRACAEEFARRGGRVVVTDLDEGPALAVADGIRASGGTAVGLRADVTRADDVAAVRAATLAHFGRVDVVMSNAGILAVGPVEAIPVEAWERVFDVNVFGTVRVLGAFLPDLLAQGSGHVVTTGSTAGLFPYGFDRLPYTASKHAVVGLSESLAVALRPRGVGVSCFCPAGVATNILEQVTAYGTVAPPRGPAFAVVDADTAARAVVDGVVADRFLIVTDAAVPVELATRGADLEAYLAAIATGSG